MNRSWPVSLMLVQSFGLLGADFTADEIRRQLEKYRPLELKIPAGLTDHPRQGCAVRKCEKCGTEMMLREDPRLMAMLAEELDRQNPEQLRFFLDGSRLCPHCGDGKFYLDIRRQSLDLKTGKVGWEQCSVIPVNREDLLLMCRLYRRGDHEANAEPLPPFITFSGRRIWENDSFSVKDEAEYLKLREAFLSRFKNTDTKPGKPSADKFKKQLSETKMKSEIFQKLTASASVMRRKDLDGYLKKSAELRKQDRSFLPSERLMLSRMAIFIANPSLWMPFICPECSKRFYVLNGSNIPPMQPLGDLLAAMEKLDLRPDYSSLCPHCHPGEKIRKLAVTFSADGQSENSAELTPGDLVMLAHFVGLETFMRRHGGTPKSFSLPANAIMRLRELLLGEKNDIRVSAVAAPQSK